MFENSKDLFETERVLGIGNRIVIKKEPVLFKSTLDVDNNDKEFIRMIENKIKECPNLFKLEKRLSKCKGYHVILNCYIDCWLCRLVFDDFRRFAYDQNRPLHARNILFDEECDVKKGDY